MENVDIKIINKKLPKHWIKYGDIYYDQYIHDYIFTCCACLESENSISNVCITKSIEILLSHIQLKHSTYASYENILGNSSVSVHTNDTRSRIKFEWPNQIENVVANIKDEIQPVELDETKLNDPLNIENACSIPHIEPILTWNANTDQFHNEYDNNGQDFGSALDINEPFNSIKIKRKDDKTNVITTNQSPLLYQNNFDNFQVINSRNMKEKNNFKDFHTEILMDANASSSQIINHNNYNNNVHENTDINLIVNNDIYKYNYCPIKFSNVLELGRHQREHLKNFCSPRKSQIRPYQCNICGKRTITMESMKIHKQRFHSMESDTETTKCNICQKLVLKANLNQHLISHTSLRLQCNYCNHSYRQKQTLRIHMRKCHPNCISYNTDYSFKISGNDINDSLMANDTNQI